MPSKPAVIEQLVAHGLDIYRAVTRVTVGDGRQTSFWMDRWLPFGVLAFAFPALFSHCVRLNVTVADALGEGVGNLLRNRLTAAAEQELEILSNVVYVIVLSDEHDSRTMSWGTDIAVTTGSLYRATSLHGMQYRHANRIWGTKLPRKIKIFMLLLTADRLSTRMNLSRKNCSPSDKCERCSEIKDGDHMFTGCALSAAVWDAVGLRPAPATVELLLCAQPPLEVPRSS
ncbi:hypothetical protein ZWY2020_049032 [Hordeum vulgare]|nr:hypothetical protein ZWY2020_049032 [Hordeum vulgare]